jgi:hypothetical protein
VNIPANITLDEKAGKADCSVCHIGVTAPPSFGGIPCSDMLAAFVVQHSTHTKAGKPSGLTASGRPSKAARDYWGAS